MSTPDSTTYTLGPYRLLAHIGRGRASRVYLAQHQTTGQTVALKALTLPQAADPRFQRAFLGVMDGIRQLDHPHILPVLDVALYQGVPCIVTPYLPRGSLDRWLAVQGPLDAPAALNVIQQVADALDDAHGLGLAHGDVRPSHLLLADDGSIRLVDFGLAMLTPQTVEVRGRMVALVGSVEVMAPELAKIGQPTPSGDVYALGVTLYELLAGSPPFQAETPLKTVWLHARGAIPLLDETRPDLPPSAVRVVGRALAKRPEERFATAGDLAAALRDALAKAPAAPVPPLPSPPSGARRRLVAMLSPSTRLLKGVPRHLSATPPVIPPLRAEEPLLPPWAVLAGVAMGLIALFVLLALGSRALLRSSAPGLPTLTPGGAPVGIPTDIRLPPTLPGPETAIWPTLVPTPTNRPTYTPWPTYTPRGGQPTPSISAPGSGGGTSGGGSGIRVTRAPGLTYTPGAVFTLGVILPQTPGAPPAPSSNAILFVRDGQIFAVNADGSGLIQLTIGPGRQFRPTRNGSQVAFASDRDGNLEIYIAANNGTNPLRLTADPGSDNDPAWSWPGDVLAFASSRSGGTDIYTMRGDGSGLALVVGDPAQDRWPSWAPVGGRLVFASNRDGGDFDLFVVNADGSGLMQLTANSVDDTAPAWSPDGNRIACVSGGNITVMDASGGNPRTITDGGDVQAVTWSPVGNQIAYSQGGDLYVIGADGGAPVRITSGGSQDTDPSWAR